MTNKTLFTQNISIMRKMKIKTDKADQPKPAPPPETPASEPTTPVQQSDSFEEQSSTKTNRAASKRIRKSKYNLHVDCVLQGQKRRKFNFDSSEVLKEYSKAFTAADFPLVQTPKTFFQSLCDLFEQEFPNMLSKKAITSIMDSLHEH